MVGITIGVGAAITLLSVGQGVSLYIAAQFEGLGTNVVYIFPGQLKPGTGYASLQTGQAMLTDRDASALSDPARVPDAAYVLPIIRRTVSATAGNNATSVLLRATTRPLRPPSTTRSTGAVSSRRPTWTNGPRWSSLGRRP